MENGMNIVQVCEFIVKPKSQIFLLLTTVFLVLFMIRMQRQNFVSLEDHPELLYVTPQVLKSWGSDPSTIYVGLYINNFPKFNMEANNFVFDAIIWFNYDPAHVSAETIGKFAFEKGEILSKSTPESKLVDSRLITQFEIRVQFSSNVNYTLFPLDDHRIFISLFNSTLSPRSNLLKSEKRSFTISPGALLEGWNYVDTHVSYGYNESKLVQQDKEVVIVRPKVVFSIDLRRAGIKFITLIFIPLFLIFFISIFSFSFDPKTHLAQMLALSLGGISSIIGYRFVIQNLSPNIGYAIFSDYVFSLLLIFIFITFVVCIVLIKRGELSPSWICIRALLLLFFHASFLLSWYFFLFYGAHA
jgi:hypothetical protein